MITATLSASRFPPAQGAWSTMAGNNLVDRSFQAGLTIPAVVFCDDYPRCLLPPVRCISRALEQQPASDQNLRLSASQLADDVCRLDGVVCIQATSVCFARIGGACAYSKGWVCLTTIRSQLYKGEFPIQDVLHVLPAWVMGTGSLLVSDLAEG